MSKSWQLSPSCVAYWHRKFLISKLSPGCQWSSQWSSSTSACSGSSFMYLHGHIGTASLKFTLLTHQPCDQWALNFARLCLLHADSTGHSERRHSVHIELPGKLHRRCICFPVLPLSPMAASLLDPTSIEFPSSTMTNAWFCLQAEWSQCRAPMQPPTHRLTMPSHQQSAML